MADRPNLSVSITLFICCISTDIPQVLVYHGGGLMVGSSEVVPQPQVDWFAKHGFVVVIPNYRLSPQVNGATSFADAVEAHDWAASRLGDIMKSEHGVSVDPADIVVLGHSSGGTLALHLASCRPVKAVTSFYPSLYMADESTSAHKPYDDPPFDKIPDYTLTEEDWEVIAPADKQVTGSGLTIPNESPSLRSKWQVSRCSSLRSMSISCWDLHRITGSSVHSRAVGEDTLPRWRLCCYRSSHPSQF